MLIKGIYKLGQEVKIKPNTSKNDCVNRSCNDCFKGKIIVSTKGYGSEDLILKDSADGKYCTVLTEKDIMPISWRARYDKT